MINIKEDQPSREIGFTRIKVRWSREKKDTSHHSSEIVRRDNQLKMILE
jgi:hypothetical protein